jgi:hypothetical protein
VITFALDMKAEVRIGNKLNYKYFNPNPNGGGTWEFATATIVAVSKNSFSFTLNGDKRIYKIGELHPIPLTEGWLLCFGFKITRTQALYIYNEFGDQVSLNKIDGKFELTYLATPIPYVHTLQNLIFALTNTELKQNDNI